MRRHVLKTMLAAAVLEIAGLGAPAQAAMKPLAKTIVALPVMKHSAFPYHGSNPETGEPFMNVVEDGRIGHQSPRGGINWENPTYSDRRSLLALPKGFDTAKPAAILVFFHGNGSLMERDVIGAEAVVEQLVSSGFNGVLAAPQFAADARDSSPGHFWQAGFFSTWLAEAEGRLAKLHGHASADYFSHLPIILVAYSGGYFPAAWTLKQGGARKRIAGVILMDGLFGDTEKFAEWALARRRQAFLFSAYTAVSRKWNEELAPMLQGQGLKVQHGLPERLAAGGFHFAETPEETDHLNFMVEAWVSRPLAWTLARTAFVRR